MADTDRTRCNSEVKTSTYTDRATPFHVLVVEDDPAYAQFVAEGLADNVGHTVEIVLAARLSDALDQLQRRPFDAITLDLNLPDSSGVDTFRQLAAFAPRVPIIVHSGIDDDGVVATLLREGAEDYVSKPAANAALDAALRHAIERHRYRETLRTTESRYRNLVEGSVQAILIHAGGVVRFANQALADLVGFEKPGDVIGQEIWPYIAPEDRPSVAEYARERTATRTAPTRYELRMIRRDGSIRWVDCTVSVIPWDDDPMLMAALVDVTDRKLAEDHVRASEERFRLLADNIKEAFVILELPTGRVLFLSRVWEDLWGRPVEQAYANPDAWFEGIDVEDRATVAASFKTLQDGEPAVNVFRLRRPDQSICWVRARTFPARAPDGRVNRVVGLIEDITAIRQTEEQLRQAQKMEAVGQLAGGIAHDFNNLLVVISGFAELVAADLGPAHRSQEDLDEIRAAADKAAALTHQLLAFSRRQILQPQILDLNRVLRSAESLLQRVIGENIALTMKLTTPLARVSADPGQVEQVILNLAVNARDAMPGGGRLTIETTNIELDDEYVAQHQGASTGQHAMIAVSDTGTGMDEATRQRLFEPFFTTKPAGRGTGLGLATVYGIVKQSRGTIWVYSEIGRGSTFRIYLPAATVTPEVTAPTTAPNRPLLGTETVLVVEDHPEVQSAVAATLRRCGYVVLLAPDADGALAAIRSDIGPVHLLLCDVVLPGMNGRELARQVLAERPDVRVLHMSGYPGDTVVNDCVLEAGLAFIQKPFTGDALLRKIREVLERPRPLP